jgi:two-component system, NtrC family, sensor kinase
MPHTRVKWRLPVPLLRVGVNLTVDAWSSGAVDWLGPRLHPGVPLRDLLGPELTSDVEERLRAVMNDGQPSWRAWRGQQVPGESAQTVIYAQAEDGRLVGFGLMVVPAGQPLEAQARADLHSAEDLQAQLQRAQRQLLQAEKMAAIGQLAAGVAHEINNPIGYVFSNINTLAGYVNDLLRLIRAYEAAAPRSPELAALQREIDIEFLTEDILALIAESQDGIDRVKQIVKALKDFSRVDDEDDFRRVDLHSCIDGALQVAANEIKYKATVVKDYAELPEVECLPSQIGQVLMNLLVNAAQAIDGQGQITVRTAREGDGVQVSVSDTGVGIAPQFLERIFEPFFTTKPVGKGTGLGLSISYSIIRKHRGWIRAESTLGQGTTFRLWLPLNRPADSDTSSTAWGV